MGMARSPPRLHRGLPKARCLRCSPGGGHSGHHQWRGHGEPPRRAPVLLRPSPSRPAGVPTPCLRDHWISERKLCLQLYSAIHGIFKYVS